MDKRLIASGHDISDGGIIVALLEMAFAGNCGMLVDLPLPPDDSSSKLAPFAALFAEELGLLLEVTDPTLRSLLLFDFLRFLRKAEGNERYVGARMFLF